MQRRSFLGGLVATAAWLLIPERLLADDPKRVYSIPKRTNSLEKGKLYIALHTAEPGLLGADEASYAGYSRQVLHRTPDDWEVTSGVARNRKAISFPACTGGNQTVTHVSLRDHRGRVMLVGKNSRDIGVTAGVTPLFPVGALDGWSFDLTSPRPANK